MQIDFAQAITADDKAAQAAEARVSRVKAETTRRINEVAQSHTRENMIGAQAAGGLTDDQRAAYAAAVQWITAMRAACQDIIADPSLDPSDDAHWPACPPEVRALAESF